MIVKTRISIFICGEKNKDNTGLVNNSPGVMEEYEISKAQNNLIIPIATTGGAARKIWDMEKALGSSSSQFDEFQQLDKEIQSDKIADLVVSMINNYSKKYN